MYTTLANITLDRIAKQYGHRFVGTPTNKVLFDFNFKQPELPKFEKSNITTVNPIKQ